MPSSTAPPPAQLPPDGPSGEGQRGVEVVSAPDDVSPEEVGAPSRGILVVDDDERNLMAIEVALGDLGRRLVKARSGREALRVLLEHDFALILLDVQMPGMDGFETARLIRDRDRSRRVPIIFITAYSREDDDIQEGYALGAVDFLFKPIVSEVLRAKASVFVELQEQTAEIRRQADRLRELERREHERRMEEEKQRWEAEALREENRRKDEFLAMLAHELRNPLAPMVTGLELMTLYGLEGEDLCRIRDSMERQVQHLTRLVDDLLDVSRISQGKITLRRQPIELGDVVQQSVEAVRPFIDERGHEFTVEGPGKEIWLRGDGVRLGQVVSNLLHNAARYTDEGGHVKLVWRRENDEAVVLVTDDGRGIAPAMLEAVFDMFVQEWEGEKGLGLGLTLVHRLVGMHQGRVVARSDGPGNGSEFEVRLPALQGRPREKDEGVEDVPADDAGSLHVVLVDDEPDVRTSMQALLGKWGHTVEVADCGEAGLELVMSERPDVALLDIGLPDLDGYTVAERIRSELGEKSPRLVALTGYGTRQDREKARRAGFDAHLTKPASPADVRRSLRSRTHAAKRDDDPTETP